MNTQKELLKPYDLPFPGPKQMLHVKVGSNERPAQAEDIDYIKKLINEARDKGETVLVTHHLVEIELIDFA